MNRLLLQSIVVLCFYAGPLLSDQISQFNQSWQGRALQQQRMLDLYSPISQNHIIGTHNSYNSEVYTACNFSVGCRYLDPQQKKSVYDQLRMGARFIELDVHWTVKMEGIFSYPKRLLLCHGVCSINDKYLTEGLNEINQWLNSPESEDQVVILYIEDHMSGHHADAYSQIHTRFGDKIYRSEGCRSIPSTLTKAEILAAGKQILLWGDGGCRSHTGWKNTAYTGLGDIGRIWEDRTTIGTIGNVITGGSSEHIDASDVRYFLKEGANIVNLDDMVTTDGRLEAAIWSWDLNEPNNWGGNQDCALQWGNSRWDDQQCSRQYPFACKNETTNQWQVTTNTGSWDQGQTACQQLGSQFHFKLPTNSKENQQLNQAKYQQGFSHVWINYSDQHREGTWFVEGKDPTQQNSDYLSEKLFAVGQLVLNSGQSIQTVNRELVMQSDGNLVLYRMNRGQSYEPLWATGTNYGEKNKAIFQTDGNLVIYTENGYPVWASNTHHLGNQLKLQSDGNLVIYRADGSAVWASNTHN